MKKVKVICDLGNSQTRVVCEFEGSHEEKIRKNLILSNRFGVVINSIPFSEVYNEDNTSIFSLDKFNLGKSEVTGTFVHGDMADKEFSSTLRPTALEQKFNSSVSVLSIMMVLKAVTDVIATMMEITTEEVNSSYEFCLSVLVPPKQVDRAKDLFSNAFIGKHSVAFTIPSKCYNFNIVSIDILAEGLMAYLGVVISPTNFKPVAKYTELLTSKVLVLDIGAGTTDALLIDKATMVENTKTTFNIGGNNVSATVKSAVNAEYDLDLPETSYFEAVKSGKLKVGAKEIDISAFIADARSEVSNRIITEVKSFLEGTGISLSSLEYLLVIGGGSIQQTNSTLVPISKYLVELLQGYSYGVELVDLSSFQENEESVGDKSIEVFERFPVNSRTLNILGAFAKVSLDEMRVKK